MANFIWNTITTFKLDESIQFYEELLGLEVKRRFKPNEQIELVFLADNNGFEVELLHPTSAHLPSLHAPENLSIGFKVDSLDTIMELMTHHGIAIAGDPVETPALRFCFVKDPNGVTVQLVEEK